MKRAVLKSVCYRGHGQPERNLDLRSCNNWENIFWGKSSIGYLLINVIRNFSKICALSLPVHLTGGCFAAPESPARRKLQAVLYKDEVL